MLFFCVIDMVVIERLGNGKQKRIKWGSQGSKLLALQLIDELRIRFSFAYHFTSLLCSDPTCKLRSFMQGHLRSKQAQRTSPSFRRQRRTSGTSAVFRLAGCPSPLLLPSTELLTSSPPTAGLRVPSTNAQGSPRSLPLD